MVIQMIAVGEESGSLDEMSAKVADFYEEDVDNAVDNLSSLLEPMIMAILGVLVGGLVVAALGGLAGLLLAWLTFRVLLASLPAEYDNLHSYHAEHHHNW